MALISSGQPDTGANFASMLSQLASKGWVIVSEGPSGAQLKKPKKMSFLDKLCLGIGIPLLFLFGVGILLILIAILDYAFFTKEKTHFLSREAPVLPA